MSRKPRLILICGGSGSGKSRLAVALAARLRAELIHQDQFMRRTDPHAPRFRFEHAQTDVFDANHPESVDFSTLIARVNACHESPVIVEGHLLLTNERLVRQAQLKVFVDAPDDIRSMRRMKRYLEERRLEGDADVILAYYQECARPGHAKYVQPTMDRADVVVDGLLPVEQNVEKLLAIMDNQE